MLREHMPPCPCNNTDWTGGGGYCGPGLSTTWFRCDSCGRSAGAIFSGFNIVTIAQKADVSLMEAWLNEVLLPFWRAEKEKLSDDERKEAFSRPSPIPPRLPKQVTAYQYVDGSFVLIDHAESYKVPIPPDPIVVKHQAFWKGVIAELELSGVTEIPNQYLPDNGNFKRAREQEPWYTCEVYGATVTFGPRKRVFSITVTRDQPFYVRAIGAVAQQAGVSYWAGDEEEVWHNWDVMVARRLTVHAWGRERLIEYMRLIIDGLRGTASLSE